MTKNLFLFLALSVITSCNSQKNARVTYKEYTYEFEADAYPKSILELYKTDHPELKLTDRDVAIKINADLILEDLIDNMLRLKFRLLIGKIEETDFIQVKNELTEYYNWQKIDFYTDAIVTDRSQQWFADSLIQREYGGKIYYDLIKRTPKPKEAYKNAVIGLIQNGEITISDAFLKEEILNLAGNYTQSETEIKCNFYLIETWKSPK